MMGMSDKKLLERQFLIEEYKALRSEIVNKMEKQYKIVGLGVGGISLLLSFAIKEGYDPLFFVLPLLIIACTLLLISEISSIRNAGEYIRTNIEKTVFKRRKSLLGWETWLSKNEEKLKAYERFRDGSLLILAILYGTCVFFAICCYSDNIYLMFVAMLYIFIGLEVFRKSALIGRRTKKSNG
jgi:hypothetical protein